MSRALSNPNEETSAAKKPRANMNRPSFKRIRIFTQGDLDSLSSLIATYVEEPELADSVEEFAFDERAWPCPYESENLPSVGTAREVPDRPINVDLQTKIVAHILGMGLYGKAVETMVNTLQWKRSRPATRHPEGDTRRPYLERIRDFRLTETAILLSLCKNITTLYMGEMCFRGSPVSLYIMLSSMNRVPRPGLQKVKHVEFIDGASKAPEKIEYGSADYKSYFNHVCRLPALESVLSDGFADVHLQRQTFPLRASTIKEIKITHAYLPSDTIAEIIKMPRSLESFTLSIGGLVHVRVGKDFLIHPSVIGEHLSRHRETLKMIEIDADRKMNDTLPNGNEEQHNSNLPEPVRRPPSRDAFTPRSERFRRPLTLDDLRQRLECEATVSEPSDVPMDRKYAYGNTVGSFDDYKSLMHLRIGIRALLGPSQGSRLQEQPPFRLIDALPPSLEHLCITGYEKGRNSDIDDHVNEFRDKQPERLPNLRVIEGVDKKVESEMDNYVERDFDDPSINLDDEILWKRPERDFSWIRA